VQRVLVAVSGGQDSIACLLVLMRLRESFGFEIAVAHFDHQLRPDSAADLAFVRDLCARLDVPCKTGEGDVRRVAADTKSGLEETGRRMRYQFLAFIAETVQADCIATGHTRDDQAETVLMRITRGSGIRGIRGMLPASDVPGATAQRLVRPLLPVRRTETALICAEAGITPLADPSNDDEHFRRNLIRHNTLPALRLTNPSIEDALLGLAASARELFGQVERQSFSAQPVARLPIGSVFRTDALASLEAEALSLAVEREAGFFSLRPEVNRTRVENLRRVLGCGSGLVSFGDVQVEASCGLTRVGPRLEPAEPFEGKVLSVPGVTVAGQWRVEVATSPLAGGATAAVAMVEGASLKGALRVRALQPGDRMAFRGMARKVSDVLINAKVPSWERPGLVAIADSERVLALLGSSVDLSSPVGEHDGLYVRVTQVP
jgi:tRNA(Ile)-lysidine synthase